MSEVTLVEGVAPANPAAGRRTVYAKSDGIYERDNAGVETKMANSPTFTNTVKFAKGTDVASAAALALSNTGNFFDVTGTTTITSINTIGVGSWVRLQFDAAVTITHSGASLILPNAVNIVTAAGDTFDFIEFSIGNWLMASTNQHIRASSETVSGSVELATAAETTTGTDVIRAVHPAGLKVELDKKAMVAKIQNDQTGATYTVLSSDADSAVTNKGNAGALVHTLPDGLTVLGETFTFLKIANQNVTITASSGDKIADSTVNGTVANTTADEIFAKIALTSWSDTGGATALWVIDSAHGTWTTT